LAAFARSSPGHVLIVDDSDDLRELFAAVLGNEGYDVMAVASGAEALACAEWFRPDVVLMDIAMPEMNGLDVVRKLKSREATRHTPVVAVTGLGGPIDHALLSREAGCALFLRKPCDNDELIHAVQSLVARTNAHLARRL